MLNCQTKKPYWIDMDISRDRRTVVDGETEFRKVVRCADGSGTVGKAGSHWKVVRSNVAARR
jgi:hypothetical protein